jgi:RNA polymerase sigma factor (sigma-70 family)
MDGVVRETTEVVRFAREQLGPACERVTASPEARALILSRMRAGSRLEDAVLWLAHREARSDARVADEFIAYFLSDLLSVARPAVSPGLRRFLDSGDLVQSVLGDLWIDLAGVEFDSRPAFLAYLTQRLRWKAADQRKSFARERRREDLRVEAQPDELALAAPDRSPDSHAGDRDELEQLALRILRLPERDRDLVRMHLRGKELSAIAEAHSLQPESARKALQRALQRLRNQR